LAKKIPMRSCTGCGAKKEKRELIRVIRTPEGSIVLDGSGRANGRGAYLCRNPECLEKARKKRALEKSLGAQIPEEVYERLSEGLAREQRSGGSLGGDHAG
jgi:predicted RNA-binding protein YlxR (DUF448 family)